MKFIKTITPLLIALIVSLPLYAHSQTLWSFFNGSVPSLEERAIVYYDNFGWEETYIGSAEQNTRLLAVFRTLEAQGIPIGADSFKFQAGKVYRLKTSVSSSASSLTLTDFSIPVTDQELTMDDFGDIGYLVIEPTSATNKEIISFTGITQNANNTQATLTGLSRGLSFIAPYTASTTLQKSHSGGVRAIISNPPQVFDKGVFKDNDETINGAWTFNGLLTFDADDPPKVDDSSITATSSDQLTTKAYVDNVTNQGAATSSETVAGIIEQATAIEVASTTQFDVDNPHTLNSEQATSTPTTGCDGTSTRGALCVPVAENDGFLSQLFIDLTEHFSFTSIFSTSASSTNATTTSAAITGDALHLNGVDYRLPSSDGASSTVLATDGAGDLNFVGQDWQLLGETTLSSPSGTTTVNVPARLDYRVVVEVAGTSAGANHFLVFNGDRTADNNYNTRNFIDYTLTNQSPSASSTVIGLHHTTNGTTSDIFYDVSILNSPNQSKKVTWTGSSFAGGVISGSAVWYSTSTANQITKIELVNQSSDTVTFDANTRVTVYGRRE